MRILQATDVYAPSIGGTERHVEALTQELRRRGHRVRVATTSPGMGVDDPPHVTRLTGWTDVAIRRRARPEQRFHPPMSDPGTVRALLEVVEEQAPDVIHAHGWMVHSAVTVGRRAGIPVVGTLHDYGLDCVRRSRLLPDGSSCHGPSAEACGPCSAATYGTAAGRVALTALRWSLRRGHHPDAYIANGRSVAAAAIEAGVECTTISPWVAGSPVQAADAPPDLPPPPFVAYVGAQATHKGVDTLARAWSPTAPAPLVALIGRSEPDAPSLPPGTTVLHDVAHPQVVATLARASVLVVPSHFPEPFGLVAAEAMAAGCPVVASAVGDLPHLLGQGRWGVLVDPGDPAQLRGAVEELLCDAPRRAELARRARLHLEETDSVSEVEAVYDRVCGQSQASPASLRR